MIALVLKKLSVLGFVLSAVGFGAATASAQTTTTCQGLPGTYVKLVNQPYALCAGAKTVNFDEVTYAKCALMKGTSISEGQKYPFPAVNAFATIPNSGNIATVNQGAPSAGGYVVSTYTPPAGAVATSAISDLAVYTCNGGGSYAQCDGGICFTSTSANLLRYGARSSPIRSSVRAPSRRREPASRSLGRAFTRFRHCDRPAD